MEKFTEDTMVDERPILGYPDLRITLYALVLEDNSEEYVVVIRGDNVGRIWNTRCRAQAKDYYMHPFVFGFEYSVQGEYDSQE